MFVRSLHQGVEQRGRSAPVGRTHSFSLTLAQHQNNPLLRKDEHIVSPGLCVTSARLVSGENHSACLKVYSLHKNPHVYSELGTLKLTKQPVGLV